MELIQPMEPILAKTIKEDKEFLHQIKWDGIRGITYIDHGNYRVFTKKGHERTGFYPELDPITALFKGKTGVIDGELIVLDEAFKPTFSRILNRERIRTTGKIPYYSQKYPVKYIVFDMMFLDGKDLRQYKAEERISLLHQTLNKNSCITLTDSFDDGHNLYELMKDKNYEGIVSKKRDSPYIGGKKHDDWYKTKIFKKMLAVVGGIKYEQDRIKSLLLGIYNDKELIYIGNASIGLTDADIQLLKEYTHVLKTEKSQFTHLVKGAGIIWVKPLLTCWVSFLEWTDGSSLRHPKIIGFSSDKADVATGKEYTYHG